MIVDQVSFYCIKELNSLKYCTTSTITDCIKSVNKKHNFVLSEKNEKEVFNIISDILIILQNKEI